MSPKKEEDSPDELANEIAALMSSIVLSEDDAAMLASNPTFFNDMYLGTKQAIFLKHWPFIIAAQVRKAERGDTASAKWLTELTYSLLTNTGQDTEQTAWEDKAIELRDALDVEVSAEILVLIALDKLLAMPVPNALTWLGLHSPPTLTLVQQVDDSEYRSPDVD